MLATPEFWRAIGYKEKAEMFAQQYKERIELYASVQGLPPAEAKNKIKMHHAQRFADSVKGRTLPGYPYVPSYEDYISRYPKYKKSKVEYYAHILPFEPPIGTELAPSVEIVEWEGKTWALLNNNQFKEVKL